jgi:transketolase
MRNKFIQSLVEKARLNDKIILLVGDLGFSVIEPFVEEFPDRFFNFGIAEQNMITAAAGLASEGFHVFVYSLANFPIFRSAEQYRNDVDYHNFGVTIVSVGGGVAYGSLGYSHHAIQDYAFMRSMPNTTIYSPGDPNEVEWVMNEIINRKNPSYLRLAKCGEPNVGGEEDFFKLNGVIRIVEKNQKKIIVTTGNTKGYALDLVNSSEKYQHYDVYSMPMWGMNYKNKFLRFFKEFTHIISVEDHLIDGGFGSWINEILLQVEHDIRPDLRIISFDTNILGKVGDEKYLRKQGGLI